ncbi:MAG: ABC transporter permease, partial [Bacillota bacterium]|nr:ABC transporter permease [Bacillota bacterium]
MRAIFKRELKSYFTSPIGYILLSIFCILTALTFCTSNLKYSYTSMTDLFQFIMAWVLMIMAPILTMKLMSEEKKLKTDQLLLTSPVSIPGIVIGKFLSALVFFLIALSSTLLYVLVTFIYGKPDVGLLIGNYLAIIFLASSFLAIGIFISSLTENQL